VADLKIGILGEMNRNSANDWCSDLGLSFIQDAHSGSASRLGFDLMSEAGSRAAEEKNGGRRIAGGD